LTEVLKNNNIILMRNRIKPLLIIFLVILSLACVEPLACADEKQKEEESDLEPPFYDDELKKLELEEIQFWKDFAKDVQEVDVSTNDIFYIIMPEEESQKYLREIIKYQICVMNTKLFYSCETAQCTRKKQEQLEQLIPDCLAMAGFVVDCNRRCEVHYEACSIDVSNKLAKATDCLDQKEACQHACDELKIQ